LRGIDQQLIERLLDQAHGARWRLSTNRFGEALSASVNRAFADRDPGSGELERYLTALHLEDLALACACADGNEAAWDHFIREQRPALYRAADALDPGGGARDLADGLYADLFGLETAHGERRSLFRYFHGRSSLITWLRAVLAQRHVDRVRSHRRVEPLPDDRSPDALPAPLSRSEPERDRYLTAMRQALGRALSSLSARDRLRLGCYYAQELTLAQTGQLLGEHEATVSRHLARTRRAIRMNVERGLRDDAGLSEPEIAQCFESIVEDAGPLDLHTMLEADSLVRKESAADRSKRRRMP